MFRYETHLHTRHGSRCGVSDGPEYVRHYLDAGYTGIFVTEHFTHGNYAPDRSAPWCEQMAQFRRGFDRTREEGEKRGLQVFFGWEQNYDGDEYLIYGLDAAFLAQHPEASNWTRTEQYERVHQHGGCVVQAHPFRDRAYIHRITLSAKLCDAVEVYNACNPPENDALAYRYALALGVPMFSGSDIHSADDFDRLTTGGIELEQRVTDEKAFAAIVRSGRGIAPHAPLRELAEMRALSVRLPVEVHDALDKDTGEDFRTLLRKGARSLP